MKQLLSVGMLVLILVGCATPGGGRGYKKSPEWVLDQTTYEHDSFTGVEKFVSPSIIADQYVGHRHGSAFFWLRYFRDRESSHSAYQIYVMYQSSDWLFLESARDADQNSLDFKSLDRQVPSHGGIQEHVGIAVTREYLEGHRYRGGVAIRISSPRGNVNFFLPPSLIEGFLMAVDGATPTK